MSNSKCMDYFQYKLHRIDFEVVCHIIFELRLNIVYIADLSGTAQIKGYIAAVVVVFGCGSCHYKFGTVRLSPELYEY